MKTIYIDMDGVLCDFNTRYNQKLREQPTISYPQSQYGFYTNLKPIKGAIEAATILLKSNQYNPYILTAPSIHNPLSYTEKRIWVESFLGMNYVEKLIISPDKSLLKGDYLIDDNENGRGQEMFEGELIQFATDQYPSWQIILEKLNP